VSALLDKEVINALEVDEWSHSSEPFIRQHPSYKRIAATFSSFTGLFAAELDTHASCIVETIIRADERRAREGTQ